MIRRVVLFDVPFDSPNSHLRDFVPRCPVSIAVAGNIATDTIWALDSGESGARFELILDDSVIIAFIRL